LQFCKALYNHNTLLTVDSSGVSAEKEKEELFHVVKYVIGLPFGRKFPPQHCAPSTRSPCTEGTCNIWYCLPLQLRSCLFTLEPISGTVDGWLLWH